MILVPAGAGKSTRSAVAHKPIQVSFLQKCYFCKKLLKWKLLNYYGIKNKYFTNLIYFEFCNFLRYLKYETTDFTDYTEK